MNRLKCWLLGHRWHDMTRQCSRCGELHFALLVLDALAPLVSSARGYVEAQTQGLRREQERIDVIPPLTAHEEIALDLGRRFPHLAHTLPQSIQKILRAEEAEAPELYAPLVSSD